MNPNTWSVFSALKERSPLIQHMYSHCMQLHTTICTGTAFRKICQKRQDGYAI